MTNKRSGTNCSLLFSNKELSPTCLQVLDMLLHGASCEAILQRHPALSPDELLQTLKATLKVFYRAGKKQDKASKILKQYPSAYDKWCPADEKRLIELYNRGKTLREIAAVLGRQPSALKNRMQKLGVFTS